MSAARSYIPILRRRREGKTDYRKRRLLLYGRKPFITVHISNYTVYGQIHEAKLKGDVVLASANSKELSKYGWKGLRKNTCAAYLTGLLLGTKAVAKGIRYAALYLGPRPYVRGSRVAAFVKGVIEAGMDVPVDSETLPTEDRLLGKHIADYANTLLATSPEVYKKRFSSLLSHRIRPEEYVKHVSEVKTKLLKVKVK